MERDKGREKCAIQGQIWKQLSNERGFQRMAMTQDGYQSKRKVEIKYTIQPGKQAKKNSSYLWC